MKKISVFLIISMMICSIMIFPNFIDNVRTSEQHNTNVDCPIGEIINDTLPVVLTNSTSYVRAIEFSHDNMYVAYGGSDDKVYIHYTSNWSNVIILTEATGTIQDIAFSPNNEYIAYSSNDAKVYVHWMSNWTKKIELTEASSIVECLAFSANNSFLVYGGRDSIVYIHNVTDNFVHLGNLVDANDWILSIQFSPVVHSYWGESAYLAVGTRDGFVFTYFSFGGYPFSSDKEINVTGEGVGSGITSLSFYYDDSYIACGSYNHNIYILSYADDWAVDRTIVTDAQITSVEYSYNNSHWLLYSVLTSNNNVCIINTTTWLISGEFEDIVDYVYPSKFSHDNEFIAYGGDSFNVTIRSVFDFPRISGYGTERSELSFYCNRSYSNNVTLKIPVTTNVYEILNLTNNTLGIDGVEKSSYSELSNPNDFYLNTSSDFLYIRTSDLSSSSHIYWTINSSYGLNFNLVIPQYIEVGDAYTSTGRISFNNRTSVDGFYAITRVLNSTGDDKLAVNPEWDCKNGNYFCTFSTHSLLPDIYEINIDFIDSISDIIIIKNDTLYLSTDPGGGVHVSTFLHFTFYNNNTGLGLNSELFKIYASTDTTIDSTDRIYIDLFGVYTGQTIYYRVDDYFDNQIYPSTGNYQTLEITSLEQFEDIPIDWYSFSVKNMNHSIVRFKMTNGSRTYSQYLYPYEPFYWNVLPAEYTINLTYYNPVSDDVVDYHQENITITDDTFYWIQGYDLRDIVISIIAVNSTVDTLVLSLSVDISIINSNITNLTAFINTFWDSQNSSFDNVNSILISLWDTENSSFNSINQTILAFWDAQNSSIDSVFNSVLSVWNAQNTSFGDIDSVLLQIWNTENTTFGTLNNTIHQFWNSQNTSFGDIDNLILQFWDSENTSFGDISNSLTSIWNTENSTFENLSITLASFWVSQNDTFDRVENTLISIWNTENSTFENVTNTLSDIWYAQNTSFGSIDTVMFQIWSTENSTFENVTNTLTQMWLNQNSSFGSIENYVIQLWGNQNSTFENVTNQITQFWANQNTSFDSVITDISALWINFNSTFGTVNQTIISLWNNINTSFDEVTNTVFNIWDSQNSSFENVTDITLSFWNAQNSSFGTLTAFINTQLNYINNSINVSFIGVNSKLNIMYNDMNISFIYVNTRVNFSYNSIIQNITEMNLTLFNKMMRILDNVSYAGESVFNKTVSILDNLTQIEINISGDIVDKTLEIINHITDETEENMLQILEILDRIGSIVDMNISGMVNQILDNLINITANYTVNMTMVIDAIDQSISQIQDTKSVIYRNLKSIRDWLNYQIMPDVTIMSYNPPMIYSVYDKEGMAFGNDYYLICPPLITIATTRVTQYGDYINSTPMIPGNGSVANGTVTIIRDVLYISGPGSITWVNITYTDNGTLFGNTTYIPSRLDIYSENITIRSDGDLSVLRVTKFNQERKFDWTYYPGEGYGHEENRAGFHTAGIEIINVLDVPLYEVYVIAGFSDESNPDANTVEIRDTTNGGIILEKGPDYDITDVAVHFNLLSLNALETRCFTIGYYKLSSESFLYDEAIVSIPAYEQVTWNGGSYNSFAIHWNNPHSETFRGALYVKLNFLIPTGIDTMSMRIYDVTFDRELDSSLFIPGSEYIRISANAMGDVLPGASRKFDVYFLMETFPGADPKEFHLDTEVFMGITPFLIIFLLGVAFIILGAFFAAWDKKNKDRWKMSVGLGIFLVVVIYILNMMGL